DWSSDVCSSDLVVAIRLFVPRAQEMRLQSGTITFNDTPTIGVNEIETVSIAVSIRGRLSSVAAEVENTNPLRRVFYCMALFAKALMQSSCIVNSSKRNEGIKK